MKYPFSVEPGEHARSIVAPRSTRYFICHTGWGVKTWEATYSDDWRTVTLQPRETYKTFKEAHAAILLSDRLAYGLIVSHPCCTFCLAYPTTTEEGRYCSKECAKRDNAVSKWTEKLLAA